MILDIKPLSVNEAWQGKRYKTNKYNTYIRDMLLILPKINVPDGYLTLNIVFGFSSKNADIDNPVKCFIDCLQKKYGFNDKLIKRLIIDVEHVKKGYEFIDFSLAEYR